MPVLLGDAVDIAYDDVGEGDPPLLCIHGFSCARSDFAAQAAHFSGRHRVVCFDQRGHGATSLARDGRYGFEATADDARALCADLELVRPVVVGHSLGGVAALRLAQDRDFASALVLLDSTVDIPAQVQVELRGYVEHLERLSGEEFRQEIRSYARARMIDPSDDPGLADALVERSAAVPQDAYLLGVRSIVGVDVSSLAVQVSVPTLFIASSLPWMAPARVHELCPRWFLGRTIGAGHFHHLLVPEQVNAMIDRFLRSVADGFEAAAPSQW